MSNFELSQKSEICYSLSFTNLDVVCSNHASFCCYLLAFYIFSRSLALCLPLYFFSLFLLTLYLIDKINETLIYSTPIRWHNNTKSQHFFCSKTRRITAFMWKIFYGFGGTLATMNITITRNMCLCVCLIFTCSNKVSMDMQ